MSLKVILECMSSGYLPLLATAEVISRLECRRSAWVLARFSEVRCGGGGRSKRGHDRARIYYYSYKSEGPSSSSPEPTWLFVIGGHTNAVPGSCICFCFPQPACVALDAEVDVFL